MSGKKRVEIKVEYARHYRYFNSWGVEIDHPCNGGQTEWYYAPTAWVVYVDGLNVGTEYDVLRAQQLGERIENLFPDKTITRSDVGINGVCFNPLRAG